MSYIIKIDDREFKADIKKDGNNFKITLNGDEINAEVILEPGSSQFTLIVENKPYTIISDKENYISVDNESYIAEVIDEQIQKLIKTSPKELFTKELAIKVPMPGLIIEVSVKQGDTVKQGQGLLIVEAMKMQNEMNTPRDGIVKKILVQKGQIVNSGDTLIIIE